MTTDFEALVLRYVDVQGQVKELEDELETLKAQIREHGSGQVGDLTVTVAQSRRFSPVLAVEKLAPEQITEITETTISATKAKKVLPPAIYEQLMYPYGDPRVTIR